MLRLLLGHTIPTWITSKMDYHVYTVIPGLLRRCGNEYLYIFLNNRAQSQIQLATPKLGITPIDSRGLCLLVLYIP